MTIFRLLPRLEIFAESSDREPIVSPKGIGIGDFVNTLSVAAIVKWTPYEGKIEAADVRVHPLSDPALIVRQIEQGRAYGQVEYQKLPRFPGRVQS